MDKSKWTYKKLGELSSFERGLTYSKSDEGFDSDVYVMRSNNIDLNSYTLNFDDLKSLRKDYVIPENKKLKKSSIFICMSNGSREHLGKVAFVDRDYDCAFGGFMGLIIPQATVFPKFLYYALRSTEFKKFLSSMGNGANIRNLKFSDLSNFLIPVPPHIVQQNIVTELDQLTEVISMKQQQLKEYEALAQSLFYEMFEGETVYPSCRLSELFEIGTGSTPSRKKESEYYNGTFNWVKSTEVHGDDINDTEEKITKKALDDTNCKLYPSNTILIAMYGQGRTRGQVAKLMVPAATNQACAAILPNPEICETDFLFEFLKLSYEKIRNMARGGTQSNLNLNLVKSIEIPLPPLSLQHSFATKVRAIEAQKSLVKQSIAETQTLLDSRMQEYFG